MWLLKGRLSLTEKESKCPRQKYCLVCLRRAIVSETVNRGGRGRREREERQQGINSERGWTLRSCEALRTIVRTLVNAGL